MRYATCQQTTTETVVTTLPSSTTTLTRRVMVKCGLPSAPDRNGLCVSCENAIHEIAEQHAEALEMDWVRDYLMGDDEAYERERLVGIGMGEED
jgi:hypothetical protein